MDNATGRRFISHYVRRWRLFLLAFVTIIGSVDNGLTFAKENIPSLYASQTVKFYVTQVGHRKLPGVTKAVLFLNGIDPLRTRIMEDALSLELMSAGVECASRLQVEDLIARMVYQTIPSTSQEEENLKNPETDFQSVESIGTIQVAKAIKAQIAITGNVLDERKRSAMISTGEAGQSLENPLVVVNSAIQIIDADTGTLLMVIVGNWPDGVGIIESVNALVQPLKDALSGSLPEGVKYYDRGKRK